MAGGREVKSGRGRRGNQDCQGEARESGLARGGMEIMTGWWWQGNQDWQWEAEESILAGREGALKSIRGIITTDVQDLQRAGELITTKVHIFYSNHRGCNTERE